MQSLIHTKSIDKMCDVVLYYALIGETELKIIKRKYLIEKMLEF